LVLTGIFVFKLGGTGQDDFFITYRYAQNLAHGDGLVFNPGERHFGVTEPGLALLLAGLHRLTGLPIPWLGTMSTAFALLAIALLMASEAAKHGRFGAGLVGGTLLLGSTWIWNLQGAAAPLVLAGLLAAARFLTRKSHHPAVSGLLAGAVIWFRPDAALGALLLGLLEWRRRRRPPWIFGTIGIAIAALGAATAWVYFGHPLPATLAVKRAMADWQSATWPSGLDFWQAFLPAWRLHLGWMAPAALIGGFAGLVPLWRHGGMASRLLVLNAAALALAYPLLGVPFYAWYAIPEVVALIYGLAFLIAEVTNRAARLRILRERGPRESRWAEAALAGGVLLLVAAHAIPLVVDYEVDPHLATYRQTGRWLREQTGPRATVAYYEVGVIGWYSERPILDLLGLITPGMVEPVRRGDLGSVLRARPVEFVIDHTARRVGDLPSQSWFLETYFPAARFSDPGGGEAVVYQRRTEALAP